MAQAQHESQDVDPITQSFIVDRQAFWQRFTNFTVYAVVIVILVLLGLWWFVA